MSWIKYDFKDKQSHPPKSGRYLIYKQGCDKVCFDRWNGSGWSNNNHDCSHWRHIDKPERLYETTPVSTDTLGVFIADPTGFVTTGLIEEKNNVITFKSTNIGYEKDVLKFTSEKELEKFVQSEEMVKKLELDASFRNKVTNKYGEEGQILSFSVEECYGSEPITFKRV